MIPTSVYVHFPWCAKKCPYCDFATTKRDPAAIPHDRYADAVLRELRMRGQQEGRRLVSVFFGGGTPSLWASESLGRVLAGIFDAFPNRAADLEVTAESNPNSLDQATVDGFADVGVNRLSIGVQSLRNTQLAYLGRLHDRAEALDALARAQQRFERVSADLMFGMPDQTSVNAEIDAVVATGVRHVSAYALTIEPGTQFGERLRLGKLRVSSDDTYANLFLEAESTFESSGFDHYEVSNYAHPGEEARHNLHYWRGGDYLGLGAAAVGCLSSGGSARRYKNTLDAERYMDSPGVLEEEETLGAEDRIREAFMLGLRTSEGVDLDALAERVGRDPLEGREAEVSRRQASGDLEIENRRMSVPRHRWLLLDGIVADLF